MAGAHSDFSFAAGMTGSIFLLYLKHDMSEQMSREASLYSLLEAFLACSERLLSIWGKRRANSEP